MPLRAWIVSREKVQERRPSERLRSDRDATAGSLTLGLSFTHAGVSRLMYRRATVLSSLVSSMTAPTVEGAVAPVGPRKPPER